jgi:tetratricopeptide (TPR) repeat protein
VKRGLAIGALLAGVAIGGSLVYRAGALEREYRELLERGDEALLGGDTFRAAEAYSAATGLRPDSMLPYLRRGEAYHARRDLDAATRDFRRAATLDPTATRPIEALGDVLYQRGWFDQAIDAYETRLRLDDRATRITYKLALARYRDGRVADALVALDATIEAGDRLVDAHYLRGVCLRELGRTEEAIQAFETAAQLSPGLVAAREELADLYEAAGRPAEELAQLQVIAGLDGTRIERHVAVGLAHARAARRAGDATARQRHADLAVLTLGQALERDPDQPLVYGALGQVWLEIAEARSDRVALSKAIEALERVVSTTAATSGILKVYGEALLRNEQFEAAERVLQQATRRYPVDPAALLSYAALAEGRRHDHAARRALLEYGALVQDDADFPQRAAAIARLSLRLNDPATATAWLERAVIASPTDTSLLAALADAQLRAGRPGDARETITRGLERDPASTEFLALARRVRG